MLLNCRVSVIELDLTELTVDSGPDGDPGRFSGPLFGTSAHRENILLVLLQTLYSHRLILWVSHWHVEQN